MLEINRSRPFWFLSNIEALNRRFENDTPENLLCWITTLLGDDVVLSTGFGISGVVLMHMLSKIRPWTPIFYIETDLHFPETLALRNELMGKLGLQIEAIHSGLSLDDQAKKYGPALWRSEPDLCCELRKVDPLKSYLSNKRGWITGVRRDQSLSRAHTKVISWDESYQVLKLAPLATWTRAEVWDYIHDHNLPYNQLLDEGYPSIGCHTCTFKVKESADERAGRWVGFEKTECGIHNRPQLKTI